MSTFRPISQNYKFSPTRKEITLEKRYIIFVNEFLSDKQLIQDNRKINFSK